MVRARPASRLVLERLEEIGAPYDLVEVDNLGRGLRPAVGMWLEPADLEPRAVLLVLGTDLEPVAHEDGELVEGEDLQH